RPDRRAGAALEPVRWAAPRATRDRRLWPPVTYTSGDRAPPARSGHGGPSRRLGASPSRPLLAEGGPRIRCRSLAGVEDGEPHGDRAERPQRAGQPARTLRLPGEEGERGARRR